MKSYIFILLFSTLLNVEHSGQKRICHVYGQFVDVESHATLKNGLTIVKKEGVVISELKMTETGKFDFSLLIGDVYTITFIASGYLQKVVEFDLQNIPNDEKGGWEMQLDGYLTPFMEGFDEELQNTPMAKLSYNQMAEEVMFNIAYSEAQQEKINAEFERLGVQQKAEEKN